MCTRTTQAPLCDHDQDTHARVYSHTQKTHILAHTNTQIIISIRQTRTHYEWSECKSHARSDTHTGRGPRDAQELKDVVEAVLCPPSPRVFVHTRMPECA